MKLDFDKWKWYTSSTSLGERIYLYGIWTPFVRVAQGFTREF